MKRGYCYYSSSPSIIYSLLEIHSMIQGGGRIIILLSRRSLSLKSTAFRIYSKSIRILDIPVPTRRPAARCPAYYYPTKTKKEEEGEEMALPREDVRARLLDHFPNGSSDKPDRWAMLWDKGDFLPWDSGAPNPALVDVLTDRKDLIGTCFKEDGTPAEKEEGGRKERKKALVPGCGRGYDVILLASFGYDAYGLEVSDKAVELCVQEQQMNGDKYPVKDESVGNGTVTFLKGDFFHDEWIEKITGGGKFDLIYDYTVRTSHPPAPLPLVCLRLLVR